MSESKSEPGTAVAVPAKPTAPIFQPAENFAAQVWSSYADPFDTVKAIAEESQPLGDIIGREIEVEHIVAHRVEILDEDTGELLERDRIIIIDGSGTQYAAVSEGIKRSLNLLMALFGPFPWKPAKRVEVRQVNTRKGFRVYKLVPIRENGTAAEVEVPQQPPKRRR